MPKSALTLLGIGNTIIKETVFIKSMQMYEK